MTMLDRQVDVTPERKQELALHNINLHMGTVVGKAIKNGDGYLGLTAKNLVEAVLKAKKAGCTDEVI